MLGTSFKPPDETMLWPPRVLPIHWTWENYPKAMDAAPFGLYFFNSLLVSVGATLMVIGTSLLAGFIFGKYQFPGKKLLFLVILASAMFPFETYMIPLFLTMKSFGWINTYQGIAAPYLIMSFGIFLMRQHIAHGIPDELVDAARVDGASELRIFLRLILPLGLPAIASLAIFQFLWTWNDLLVALTFGRQTQPITVAIYSNMRQFGSNIDLIAPASFLSLVIPLAVFFAFQRYFVQGLLAGSVK
jgi:alpha-glucoside transport system permease protein